MRACPGHRLPLSSWKPLSMREKFARVEAELHQLLLASGRAHVLLDHRHLRAPGCRLLQPVTSSSG